MRKLLPWALAALLPLSAIAQPAPAGPGLLTQPVAQWAGGCAAGVQAVRSAMDRARAAPPGLAALAAFDAGQKLLEDAGSRAVLAAEIHPDPAIRAAGQACQRDLSALGNELSLDRGLYDVLSRIDASASDPATRFYLSQVLLRFRLAGVDRDEATRARARELRNELTRLSQAFNRNIREGTLGLELDAKSLDGLPADFLRSHPPGANGKVRVSTEATDYGPFMSYSRDAAAREALWRLSRQRAPGNLAVLDQMLAKRHELATLLGFAHWADYATADKMVGDARRARDFIDRVSAMARPRAAADYAQLLARKRKDEPAASEVHPWDTAYLADRVKAEQYGLDSQELRPYFSYAKVKQAVFDVSGQLFGIRYVPVRGVPVWHPSVEVYDVFEGERRLGRFYLDMHPRDGKRKSNSHFRLTGGQRGTALPESVLTCNLPETTASDPGLMDYNNVRTLFHEFGHLLHNIFGGHTEWAGLAGVRTERDFVEAPSQMLEEWMRDTRTLQSFAVHYQTKQPVPAALVERLRRAEEFNRGLALMSQLQLAAVSLGLHDRDPKGLDTTRFFDETQQRFTPFKPVPGTHFQTAFGHLDGYSAIYYTYQWSLVIAKDLFSEFARGDIMDPAVAMRYRRAVLEPGGSKPAAELVSDFLGRPYSFEAYRRWLE